MTIALFLLILAETLLGSVAVAVPLTMMGVVWFTAAWGWQYGLGGAVLAGWVLAVLSGNAALYPVMLAVSVVTAWRCARRDEEENAPSGRRTGFRLALAAFGAVLLSHPVAAARQFYPLSAAAAMFLRLASCLIFSMILLPAEAFVLEKAADWFGLSSRSARRRRGWR